MPFTIHSSSLIAASSAARGASSRYSLVEIEPKALPNRWQFSIRHVLITTAITAVVVLLGTFALNRIIDTSTPRLGYVKNSRVFDEPIDDSASVSNDLDGDKRMTVSYTHLTLPTIYSV